MVIVRPGTYEVEIVQACPNDQAGSTFTLTLGKASLAGTVTATGDWERFATKSLGTLKVTDAGKLKMSLKPTKKVAGAVMNIRAIVLRPR